MARSGIVLLPSQAQTICYHGDKLRVRRLPLYTAYGITEELLEYFNIAAIPCDLYRVAYARSTRDGVVLKRFATSGYKTLVTAFIISMLFIVSIMASRR